LSRASRSLPLNRATLCCRSDRRQPQHHLHRRPPPRRHVPAPLRCQDSTVSTRGFELARHLPCVALELSMYLRAVSLAAASSPLPRPSAHPRALRARSPHSGARCGFGSWAGPAVAAQSLASLAWRSGLPQWSGQKPTQCRV
jgi:hypothetical protein